MSQTLQTVLSKGKVGKVVSAHAMNVCWNRGTAPLLTLMYDVSN